ncbi:YchJ family protein [Legionella fallonii]|uniref:Putative SEC-C motif domain protein n=1 Tax=Legionella fallonii LLAP-10 TaxID=1212491 RepID=A0A098G2I8_9GAMM|nr:YchJ family protein [Legionella fallonii]CEG56201.1 putative SEC-C motif domain protein [Legionella fallonii LLAP-10]
MSHCPCGSEKSYEQCCGLFIEQKQIPQTPEQLMRSRYTAYSLAKTDYIKNTMKGKALTGFDEAEVKAWAQCVTLVGLKVIQAYDETSDKGFVEFSARFKEGSQFRKIHELSEFHKENGVWYYVAGQHQDAAVKNNKQKTSRNNPCPCGSGKKFKNCHGRD